VNQLSRNRELDVQRLVKAGEALEQAQRDAMAGEAVDFDAARKDEGEAIRRLRDAAEELLPSASTPMLDRVARTLRATAASAEGRALLKTGRLEEDLEPPGFEALAGLAPSRPPRKRGAPKRAAAPAPSRRATRRAETLRRRKEEADEKAERAAEEARELERAAREADQAAKKALRAAEAARKRADAATAQAERVDAELAELEER
jgi:predicted ribosome quality control (RQC) complex YloA/Tae2 family protein